MLTAIDQIETATATTVTYTSGMQQMLELEREYTIQEATEITVRQTLPFLNVQRLMAIERALYWSKLMAPVLPTEARTNLLQTYIRPIEEEIIEKKRILPRYETQRIEVQKRERLTREIVETELKLVPLYERSILIIEQLVLAELESYLMRNYPLQVFQALQKLVETCVKKQWYIERISGLEHLQKMMAQMYLYPMMEYPLTYNMFALRVTPLTMTALRHYNASIYATHAMVKQEAKQKATLKSATKQKETAKTVLVGKKRYEVVPSREHVGTTEDLTEETQVSTGKDEFGREWLFIALRYAYTMPYWLRRMLVRMYGMPENHKYARYFGIGCIPTRRTMRGYKRMRYGREPWTERDRDEYLKWFRERYGREPTGVPYSQRYGGFKFTLHRRGMFPPYYTVP